MEKTQAHYDCSNVNFILWKKKIERQPLKEDKRRIEP